jgi:transcriptional regulator of arginine metabolism
MGTFRRATRHLRICAYALLYAQFYSFDFAMPSATLEQHERRRAIARLLEAHAIQRQAELVDLLRREGFPATQSSVSRDLRDLGAAKMKNGYSLPKPTEVANEQALQVVAESVREIRTAGPNLLVIMTQIGAAQRVAVTLDRIAWPEIVGTLSGDDTIFVATVSSTQQRRLRGRLRQHLKKATP